MFETFRIIRRQDYHFGSHETERSKKVYWTGDEFPSEAAIETVRDVAGAKIDFIARNMDVPDSMILIDRHDEFEIQTGRFFHKTVETIPVVAPSEQSAA